MSSVLAEICAAKHVHITASKAQKSLLEQENCAKLASPPRGFIKALSASQANAQYGLICEVKKASPSKGLIRADFDPKSLAEAYEAGGATCMSVLTDEPYFQGHNDYLIAARDAVSLPTLRKDFMLDPYQVTEARAIGADCILLIMACLSDDQAQELEAAAHSYNMDVLIEVHDGEELDRALKLKSPLIGINNRNLKTMTIDLQTTLDLVERLPSDRIAVGESGLATRADLDKCAEKGVNNFLIGESLMRQDNVETATAALLKG